MKNLLVLALFSALLFSCNQNDENNAEDIKKEKTWNRADYEGEKAEIYALKDTLIKLGGDPKAKAYSQKLLAKSVIFADNYPGDEESADFLFIAARAANGLGQYGKSIELLDRIIRKYGNYKRLVDVYFLKAFTFDEDLDKKAEAKKAYIEIIQKFPDDPMAEQSEMLLENLYLTDEEIIQKYQSKN